ncbi:hypothetical protein JW859_04525 [bacterium]|nr:hypothetical protein [bacterium]
MRYFGSAIALIMLLMAACGGGQTAVPDPQGQNTPTTPADYGLPSPSALAHTASANSTTQLDASEFLATHYDNVLDVNTTAEFMPDWPTDGSGNHELAWAVYPFTIDTAERFSRVELDWHSAPVGWIGVSDFSTDSWNWSQGSAQAALPGDLSDYVDESDVMYVLAAVYGQGTFLLNELNLIEQAGGGGLTNLFFLHHSTGQGIINGGVRSAIAAYNTAHSTSFEFWDHCYTWESLPDWPGGLVDPDGNATGTSYGGPCDDTDPPDLYEIWTSGESNYVEVRNNILDNHEVIAFKSCFPASAISSSGMLQNYKDYYLGMRDVFDAHLDHLFVVMSTPPLHPDETNAEDAARARQFANWLKSSTYLSGHPNVVCFDLFDQLASDGSDGPINTLRTSYLPDWTDSHPNAAGNAAVAPVFANFLCDSAVAYAP